MALIQESNEDGGFLAPGFWSEAVQDYNDGTITLRQFRDRISAGLAPYGKPSRLTPARQWLGGHLVAVARWLDPSLPSWDDMS